jgi:hypothetical protein
VEHWSFATQAGGGCIARPSEAAWGEPGFLENEGVGTGLRMMVGGGDDIDLESGKGCRSSDPTPAASPLTWKRQNVPVPLISEARPGLRLEAVTMGNVR